MVLDFKKLGLTNEQIMEIGMVAGKTNDFMMALQEEDHPLTLISVGVAIELGRFIALGQEVFPDVDLVGIIVEVIKGQVILEYELSRELEEKEEV